MKKVLIIILYIFFFSANLSWAQQYYCRNYTVNEGLPSNCINELYKDSRGFLWIGTNAGLAKFDGTEFVIYTSQDGLAGDNIQSICEGGNGAMWIASYNAGLSKLIGKEIQIFDNKSGLVSNTIKKLHYSKKYDVLFIGTEDGLTIYDEKNGFKSFHKKYNNVDQRLQITEFIEKEDYVYIFTNGSGLFKYILKTESLIRMPFDTSLNNNTTNSIFLSDQHSDILININRTDLKIISNNKTEIIEKFGVICDFKQDFDKNIWIAGCCNNFRNTGGIFKYTKNGIRKFNKYLDIKSNDILSLEFDNKENILWIGTKDNGLYLYPLTNFSYYKAENFELNELNIVDLLIDINNCLWIATKNGIIIKDNEKYEVFPVQLFNNEFEKFAKHDIKKKYQYLNDKDGSYKKYRDLILNGKYSFANPYISIVGDKQKIILAKSLFKPLKYDVITNKKLNEINGIYKDKKGNIWVGSNVGIFKVNKARKSIRFYDLESKHFSKFVFGNKNELIGSSWNDLFIYPEIEKLSNCSKFNYFEHKSPININNIKVNNDKIWFLSWDHGASIYSNNNFYTTYNSNEFGNISFSDICFDKQNNQILAGINGVIYITNFNNNILSTKFEISKKNGLIGSSVRWVKCTKDNLLIAGTNSGLNIINLNELYNSGIINIKTIDKSLGFIDYAGNTSVIDKNNNLWVGSNKHLIKIDLDQINKQNNQQIDFFIKSIYVNDEPFDLKNIEQIDIWTNIPKSCINLPYYKNSISFYFDVIQYLNPDQISFSYKLDGTGKDWSEKNNDRKIVFQNLKPGDYRLRIKVFKSYELNTNRELSVNFTISSPLWSKWYFISAITILLLIIIWLIIFVRIRSIKRKERLRTEISERITEFEMKALRAQMNPHFIFNAINSIQNFMLDSDIDAALNYLSDFAKLIRLTLDNVSKKRIYLEDELEYLKYYLSLEKMRFDKKFEVEITTPKELSYNKFLIPPMIIQPYIENSIKHGFIYKTKGAKIKLVFEQTKDEFLKCIIEDNGIGREKSQKLNKNNRTHKSKGTFITNERLSLLNQTQQKKGYKVEIIDLYDEHNLASGTRVEIFIPL